jgi:hypothetical protein
LVSLIRLGPLAAASTGDYGRCWSRESCRATTPLIRTSISFGPRRRRTVWPPTGGELEALDFDETLARNASPPECPAAGSGSPNWMRRAHGASRKHRASSGGSSMKCGRQRKRIAERPVRMASARQRRAAVSFRAVSVRTDLRCRGGRNRRPRPRSFASQTEPLAVASVQAKPLSLASREPGAGRERGGLRRGRHRALSRSPGELMPLSTAWRSFAYCLTPNPVHGALFPAKSGNVVRGARRMGCGKQDCDDGSFLRRLMQGVPVGGGGPYPIRPFGPPSPAELGKGLRRRSCKVFPRRWRRHTQSARRGAPDGGGAQCGFESRARLVKRAEDRRSSSGGAHPRRRPRELRAAA